MAIVPIYENQNFFAPYFVIRLGGQDVRQSIQGDVLEVTYKENLKDLDSFEFTLNDWDPVERIPKYSSPFTKEGEVREGVPRFEPGEEVELALGYQGAEEPTTMMKGTVVSISPNFPASGTPTLRVRALNLLYLLQTEQDTRVFEGKKDSDIAQELVDLLEGRAELEVPNGQRDAEREVEHLLMANEYPIIFLMRRARRLGYDLFVTPGEDDGAFKLFFGKREGGDTIYELEWGKSLIQFTPTVKTKNQVSKVTVRGWDPTKTGNERIIEGVATLDQLEEPPQGITDPELRASIDAALAESHEVVVDQAPATQEEADEMALGFLRDNVKDLITGRGLTVGLPNLRAGRKIRLEGLGPRYSGEYLLTEVTHTFNSSGYTTQFSARMDLYA